MSLNKKEFLKRVLKETQGISWPKEMKLVNRLLAIFPNDVFWNSLQLKFKLNSTCWFLSDEGRKFLNTEYKKFNFDLQSPTKFEILDTADSAPSTTQESSQQNTQAGYKNIKNFLNLW